MPIREKIELDNAQFIKSGKEVEAASKSMMRYSQQAMAAGAGGDAEGLSRRQQRTVAQLAGGLANAQSPAEALALSLEKVGKLFKLGAGVGIGALIGAQMITAGKESNEAYRSLIESDRHWRDQAQRTLRLGSFEQIITLGEEASSRLVDLAKRADELKGAFGGLSMGSAMGALFGGPTQADMRGAAAAAIGNADFATAVAASAATNEISKRLEIQKLLTEGKIDEAKALQTEAAMEKEIATIMESKNKHLSQEARKKAVDEIRDRYASITEADQRAKAGAERNKTTAAEAKEDKARKEGREIGETDEEKAARLRAERDAKAAFIARESATRDAGGKMNVTESELAEKKVEMQQILNDLKRTENKLLDDALAKREKQDEADRKRIDSEQDFADETAKLRAHGAGDTAGERAIDEAMKRRKYTEQLDAQGIPYTDALRMAGERVDAERDKKHEAITTDASQRAGRGGYFSSGERARSPEAAELQKQTPLLEQIRDAVKQRPIPLATVLG